MKPQSHRPAVLISLLSLLAIGGLGAQVLVTPQFGPMEFVPADHPLGVTGYRPTDVAPNSASATRQVWLPAWGASAGSPSTTNYTASFVSPSDPGLVVDPDWTGTFTVEISAYGNPYPADSLSGPATIDSRQFATPFTAASPGFNPYFTAATNPIYGYTALYSGGNGGSTVTWDFSGLVNGYLPAGTVMWFSDLDQTEDHALALTSSSTTPFLDYLWAGSSQAAQSGGVNISDIYWDATTGAYSSDGNGLNGSGYSVFRTNQDLTTLTFVTDVGPLDTGGLSNGFQFSIAAPVAAVPEPSGALLLGLTGTLGLLRRRRR